MSWFKKKKEIDCKGAVCAYKYKGRLYETERERDSAIADAEYNKAVNELTLFIEQTVFNKSRFHRVSRDIYSYEYISRCPSVSMTSLEIAELLIKGEYGLLRKVAEIKEKAKVKCSLGDIV